MTTEESASNDAVFEDVFASGRDRGGNSAPPEDTTVKTPDASEQTPPADDVETPSPEVQDPNTGKMVPLNELLSERGKRKEVSTELEALRKKLEENDADWRRRFDEFSSRSQPQQPQPRPAPLPDPLAEPDQYAEHVSQSAQSIAFQERLNRSEDRVRDKHGDALVDEAFAAAQRAGLIQRSHFIQSAPRHPWGAMVDWYQQQKVLETVGNDPDAYRKKVEEEVRAKVLEELKAGNGPGHERQPQRFPGTLADATATGQQGAHLTDEAVMGSVFSTNRKRK